MLMMMIIRLKLTEKKNSVTTPGVHILLGYDDAQSFETPRINNHSFNAPSVLVFWVMMMHSPLKLPKTITVLLHQVPIFF